MKASRIPTLVLLLVVLHATMLTWGQATAQSPAAIYHHDVHSIRIPYHDVPLGSRGLSVEIFDREDHPLARVSA